MSKTKEFKVSESELKLGKLVKALIGAAAAEHLLGRPLSEADLIKLLSGDVMREARRWREDALGEVRQGQPMNLTDLVFYALFEALSGYTTSSLLLDEVQGLLPDAAALGFAAALPTLIKKSAARMEQVLG